MSLHNAIDVLEDDPWSLKRSAHFFWFHSCRDVSLEMHFLERDHREPRVALRAQRAAAFLPERPDGPFPATRGVLQVSTALPPLTRLC